ncbi:MAG: hypothetical protein AAGG44_08250, partial [Planctomycetota bacterium]
GLKPLQLEIDSISAGWFSPVKIQGIHVANEGGEKIAEIESITTEKGLLSWFTASSNLKVISLTGLETNVVAENGTTNLEQAIQHLIPAAGDSDEVDPTTEAGPLPTGTIAITDSKVTLAEAGRPEQWQLDIESVQIQLPKPGEVVGPIDARLALADVSGTIATAKGTIAADVQQVSTSSGEPAFEVRAKVDQLPVHFWHVAKARLPELPVEELAGDVSVALAGTLQNESSWNFELSELKATQLRMDAPDLVGSEPLQMQQILGKAHCSVADSLMTLSDTQLQCDFAATTAQATIPWPPATPTLEEPFLQGADIEAAGVVDLPRLAQAARTLIPVREDTQLSEGQLKFQLAHHSSASQKDKLNAKLELANLTALSAGQTIRWETPLVVDTTVSQAEAANGFSGFDVAATVAAEFANLNAKGTLDAGRLAGNLDLARLREKLSRFVDLPITSMNGTAEIQASWNRASEQRLVAGGNLNTTPITIVTLAGNELREPAWQGDFKAALAMNASAPEAIESASLNLNSRDERLAVNLLQPLFLEEGKGQPADFNVDLHLDLGNCNRRGTVWLAEPTGVNVNGQLQLAASGRLTTSSVELSQANWNGQPIEVETAQMSFAEPQIQGNFRGKFDSNNITSTVIDELVVTSSSFSLNAQDQAAPDATAGRVGRARFLVDLGQLLRNAKPSSATSLLPAEPDSAPAAQISATGRFGGDIAWNVNSTAAGINMLLNGEQIVVTSLAPGQMAPTELWQETQVNSSVKGFWQAEGNQVSINEMSVQLPWLAYAGTAEYQDGSSTNGTASAKIVGQAKYDCQQLTQKLTPYTGGQVLLAGQETVPIEVTWTGTATRPVSADAPAANSLTGSTETSALAGLNATTRLGWQQANVAGIQLGKADVPVAIVNGHLMTAAEIPVSGGFLRWDIDSDLTAPELALNQKPMTLLENVQITKEMCDAWLKYVTPLVAETASVDGRLSLHVDQAKLTPANPTNQTVVGQLVIHNARIGPGPLSNSVIGIVKQLEAIRKKEFTQSVSNTQRVWMDMPEQQINFAMRDGRVAHENLSVDVGDATISTQGSVGVDGTMQMLARMPIPNDWADKSPLLEGLRGQSLDFPVGGTVSNPQIDTRLLTQLGRQTIQNAASGILQQGINRGLDKLLGGESGGIGDLLRGPATNHPPANPGTNPPAGPGTQTPQNPNMGIGEQILRGSGIDLPGIFGGRGK